MAELQSCFQRVEKKYLLNPDQYRAMREGMAPYMTADRYTNYTICNIYYDTPDYELIRTSLEKPAYKEKLRVRSYGRVGDDGTVFVELKKKFRGVVYKRRVAMTAAEACAWLWGGEPPERTQIHKEIEWFMRSYQPIPRAFIGYDREAYAGTECGDLRITFDTNLRWRDRDLDLRRGDRGTLLLPPDQVLMEIKIPGAAPLWLASLLSENQIFSTSFSKYGTYFKDVVMAGANTRNIEKEVLCCA